MAKLIATKTYGLVLNQEELDVLYEVLDLAHEKLYNSMSDLGKTSKISEIVCYLQEHYRGDIPF